MQKQEDLRGGSDITMLINFVIKDKISEIWKLLLLKDSSFENKSD